MKTNYKELLGLTQEDIAAIIGVKRNRFAQYVIGRRDLPSRASQIVTELILFWVKRKKEIELVSSAKSRALTIERLKDSLGKNEQQSLETDRKLKKIQEKCMERLRGIETMKFLNSEEQLKKWNLPTGIKTITPVLEDAHDSYSYQFDQLRIKQRLLTAEKEILEDELKKMTAQAD